jgi:hypothetical protein
MHRDNFTLPVGVNVDVVLDWTIGFIHALYTILGTTGNYSALVDLHTLQFTLTYALGFSVFLVISWQRIYNSFTVPLNHT